MRRKNRPPHKGPLFRKEKDGTFTIGAYKGVPNIRSATVKDFAPEAWFLGPNGENKDELTSLIADSIEYNWGYRNGYLPTDPPLITAEIKESDSYKAAVTEMRTVADELQSYMSAYATPFFSPRYQAHMTGENPIAAMVGYFSGMLHNPNNVTIEAATSTVPLEVLVGKDLCHMIGYMDETKEPFCHLNSGGSLCVIESLWTSREVRFFPLSTRMALQKAESGDPEYAVLKPAYDIVVPLCDGTSKPLVSATNWELFNVTQDAALDLPQRIHDMCVGTTPELIENDVWDLIDHLSMNQLGWNTLWAECEAGIGAPPVYCVPSTKHYSWPKGAALLGYGKDTVRNIVVDEEARMNTAELRNTLEQCLTDSIPVASVTCVFGSTEESSVDDITEVLAIREEYRGRGLDFQVIVDAAWGGYLTTIVRNYYELDPIPGKTFSADDIFLQDTTNVPLSERTIQQIKEIHKSDAVIIDPHKYGYIQYPAAAILYRNGALKNLTLSSASYIGMDIPPVGICGIEGSRPGAAASCVFTAHRCINPSVTGYGKILTNSMFNAKKIYTHMLMMEDTHFKTMPLNRLPAEQENPGNPGAAEEQKEFIREYIYLKTNEEIMGNAAAMELFKEMGPDQNIVDYGFNFLDNQGVMNNDITRFNQFNEAIYEAFSIEYEDGPVAVQNYPFLVSRTMFKVEDYGEAFVRTYAERNGLDYSTLPPEGIFCCRSTVMDPLDSDKIDLEYYQMLMPDVQAKIEEIASSISNPTRRWSWLEE